MSFPGLTTVVLLVLVSALPGGEGAVKRSRETALNLKDEFIPSKQQVVEAKAPILSKQAASKLAEGLAKNIAALKIAGAEKLAVVPVKVGDNYIIEIFSPRTVLAPPILDDSDEPDTRGKKGSVKDVLKPKKTQAVVSEEKRVDVAQAVKNYLAVSEVVDLAITDPKTKLRLAAVGFSFFGPARDDTDLRATSSRSIARLHRAFAKSTERVTEYGFNPARPIGGGFSYNSAGDGTIGGIVCDTRTNWPYAMSNGHVWTVGDIGTALVHHNGATSFGTVKESNNDKPGSQVDVAVAKLSPTARARNAIVIGNGNLDGNTGIHVGGQNRPIAGAHETTAVTKGGSRLHHVTGFVLLSGSNTHPIDASRKPDYLIRADTWAQFADAARTDLNLGGDNWNGAARWVPNNEPGVFNAVRAELLDDRPPTISKTKAKRLLRDLWAADPSFVTAFSMGGDSGSWVRVGTEVLCLNFGGEIQWRMAPRQVHNGPIAPAPVPNALQFDNGRYWVYGAHRDGSCYSLQSQITEVNRLLAARPVADRVEWCNTEYPMPIKYTVNPKNAAALSGYAKGDGIQNVAWLKQTIANAHGLDPANFAIARVDGGNHALNDANALLNVALPDPPYEVLMTQN